jgi:hypothetical protein
MHLLLEEMEIDARPPSPPSALVVHQQQAPSGPSSTPRQGNPSATQQRSHGVPTGGQRTNVVVVAAAGVMVANSPLEGVRPLPDRVVHRRACTRPSHSLGRARCRCGHMAALRLSRPSPSFHSTAGLSAAFPTAASTTPATLRPHRMSTVELCTHRRHSRGRRRPIRRLHRRPGTPLMEAHGTRTPSCSHSTP